LKIALIDSSYATYYIGLPFLRFNISQTPANTNTARLRIRTSISWDVPIHPSFRSVVIAPTYGAMTQAKLNYATGSVPRWFTRPKTVTHPCANRSRCKVITLIESIAIALSQCSVVITHLERRMQDKRLQGLCAKIVSDTVKLKGMIC